MTLTGERKEAAIQQLQRAVSEGRPWFRGLLGAMGKWTEPEELFQGRHLRYLVGGEAFDWLLLAERLCHEINGDIPEREREALLFRGQPPEEVSREEFRRLIGPAKFRAFLNYFYGVVVEEALQEAVAEEVRKECRGWCSSEEEIEEEAFQRIYDGSQQALVTKFRQEKGLPRRRSLTVAELKEFTYWLFRYRVERMERARVASDTRKGLEYLRLVGFSLPWAAPAVLSVPPK